MQNKLISFFFTFSAVKMLFLPYATENSIYIFKIVIFVFIVVDCTLGNIDQKLEAL